MTSEWEQFTQELTRLKNREFWVKRRGDTEAIKQRTLDMPDPDVDPTVVNALIASSGARYGRLKRDVRWELQHERPRLLARLVAERPSKRSNHGQTENRKLNLREKKKPSDDETGQNG